NALGREPIFGTRFGLGTSLDGGKQRGQIRERVWRGEEGAERRSHRAAKPIGFFQSKSNRRPGGAQSATDDFSTKRFCGGGWLNGLRFGPGQALRASSIDGRQNTKRSQSSRTAGRAADKIRAGY